jgi:serine/threonine protein kinase/Flp pilus assembly protein TadD
MATIPRVITKSLLDGTPNPDDACSGTTMVRTSSSLATTSSEDASSFMVVESSEDGPRGGSDAGRAEELVARLVREMFDVCCQGGASRFEDFLARYPQLPDLAFRLIAEEARLRQELGDGVSAVEIGRRLPQRESEIAALLNSYTVLPRAQQVISAFPAVGETVGEFRLLASLGRGVRGAVFLADQPSLANRPVVLKITSCDGREHLSLAQLQHAHIVPLYCVQDLADRDLRLLCMPYLGGTTLGRLLSELGEIPIARRTGRDLLSGLDRAQAETPLSVPSQGPARQFLSRASYLQAVCWIGACLADALQFAHQRELLHLDLKPSNVLLAADGTPMLLDFHLAQPPIRPNESARHRLGGTPNYMPPEQWVAMMEIRDGRAITAAVDGRSDIYALGVMLYEMLGGAIPFGFCPTLRMQFRRPPQVPVGLADIVAKCLAFDSRDRYPDAAQLAEDLRRHLADLPLRGVSNRSLTERWQKWRRRRPHALGRAAPTAVASAALLVAVLVVVGDARQRLRGAESLLAESRKYMDSHDYPAAVRALNRGLALIDQSWALSLDRHPFRSHDLRRDLRQQLALAQRTQLAEELHELADRLRLLYGTDLPATGALRALELRLRTTWEARGRILAQLGGGLDPEIARRFRTDFLDLGILWADLRIRLASGREADARRDALRTLEEAERLFGASPVLVRERQSHAEALGLTDVARAAARCRAELAPETAWEHYTLGRSLLAAGALEAAASEFDRATDLQPQDLWAQLSRGICAYRRRCFDTALSAFDVCVALSPGTAECYYNRARAHAALGHTDLALRDYNHALRLAPTMALASLNRGILYYREKRYSEAIDDFRRAMEGGASPAAVHHNLALVHLARGDCAAARADLRRALGHEPAHARARDLLDHLEGHAAAPAREPDARRPAGPAATGR